MSLVKPLALLEKAKKNKKGVGAFNVLSLEMIQGVIDAAEEAHVPVILQISTGAMRWARFEYIVPMVLSAAKNAQVDIAVHLDHCQNFELIQKAVKAGFTSVMYDGSHFPLKTNIENSKKIINYCHNKVDVELEIGQVGGKEDDIIASSNDTLMAQNVLDFYQKTKPSFLAVAFGTAHGIYKGKINLDFSLIKNVAQKTSVPLVMHGTSGVPFDMIRKSIEAGVTKINVGTDLLIANNHAIREYLIHHPQAYDIRKINTVGINAIKKKVLEYIKVFEGQSWS